MHYDYLCCVASSITLMTTKPAQRLVPIEDEALAFRLIGLPAHVLSLGRHALGRSAVLLKISTWATRAILVYWTP